MDYVPGLRVERPREGVVLVTFDRPERYNAFDEAIIAGLPKLLAGVAADETERVVVFTGAGNAFCAGADLELIESMTGREPADVDSWLCEILQGPLLIQQLPQPTIAAVNGPAAGAGLGIALACDIRLAGPEAHFSSPFVHMALVPDYGVSWLLPRVVGEAHAMEMMLSGKRVRADEAQALGLVSRVVGDPLADALDLAGSIAAMAPGAVTTTRRMARHGLEIDLAESIAGEVRHQADALRSPEFAERFAHWRAAILGD
jgi:enoyl-CoA hydratase/carnithine racemase